MTVDTLVMGLSGQIAHSEDHGLNFVVQDLAEVGNLRDAAYGNGRWVLAGGMSGRIMISDDGKAWEFRDTPMSGPQGEMFYAVAYGNEMFVAGTWSGSGTELGIIYSLDYGETWQLANTPTAVGAHSIAYADGVWMATAWGRLHRSLDGINWTEVVIPWANESSRLFDTVAYREGVWLTTSSGSQVLPRIGRSIDDGQTWDEVVPKANDRKALDYHRHLWVMNREFWVHPLGYGTYAMRSSDGLSWTSQNVFSGSGLSPEYAMVYNGVRYIAFGGSAEGAGYVHSSDLNAWTVVDWNGWPGGEIYSAATPYVDPLLTPAPPLSFGTRHRSQFVRFRG